MSNVISRFHILHADITIETYVWKINLKTEHFSLSLKWRWKYVSQKKLKIKENKYKYVKH